MKKNKNGKHGKASSEKFIAKYSIIYVGKNNRYGHLNDIVLGNLDDSKICKTDQDGSIKIKIIQNNVNISNYSA